MSARRISLATDNDRVDGDLKCFPVLVDLHLPDLRSLANGGSVATELGTDIHFSSPDSQLLGHDLVA